MNLRQAKREDWNSILKLSRNQDYPLPDFKHLTSAVVIENDKNEVIAYAHLVYVLEASIMLDFDQSLKNQVQALKMLNIESLAEADRLGFKSFFAFVKDSSFVKLLQNKFNYKPTNGNALYLEVQHGRRR